MHTTLTICVFVPFFFFTFSNRSDYLLFLLSRLLLLGQKCPFWIFACFHFVGYWIDVVCFNYESTGMHASGPCFTIHKPRSSFSDCLSFSSQSFLLSKLLQLSYACIGSASAIVTIEAAVALLNEVFLRNQDSI